jgi:lysine-specific demethylase/histidyl-hydroxylase NO66
VGEQLNSLWSRIDRESFLSRYWQIQWLHARATKNTTGDLVRLSELERLLFDFDGSKHPIYAVGDYLKERLNTRTDDDLLQNWYRGRTLVFQHVDRRLPIVSGLTRRWEEDLGCRLRCNLYLTPPNAQGFQAHYDPLDVFVLQVRGSKEWCIGQRAIEYPLLDQTCDLSSLRIAADATKIVLQPDDVLYLPGGWVHEAKSANEISCHLTFGVLAPRYLDLLVASLKVAATRDPVLRRPLPIDKDISLATILCLLRRLDANDIAEACQNLQEDEAASQPRPTAGALRLLYSLSDLAETDLFSRNPVCKPHLSYKQGGIELTAFGKQILFPKRFEAAVRFCLQGKQFFISGIPGDLSSEERISLVRQLLMEGIVVKLPQGEEAT